MGVADALNEKLAYKVSFYIHLGDFRLPVPESVVVTWGIMAVLVILSIIFTRNLQIVPTGKQAVFESLMSFIYGLFYSVLGEQGKKYIPYLITVLLYLGCANICGLFGFTPPTKDINTTLGLALMSIVLIEFSGIRSHGVFGWVKSFSKPSIIITPLNILEIAIRPTSLCMRLFGNILGSYIIMELIIYSVPMVVPLIASVYFDIFDGLLQAYIFCFLTALFIQEKIE